jgi:hypothetical protein
MIRGLLLFCLLWPVITSPLQARSPQPLQHKGHSFCGTYPGRLEDDLRKYQDLRLFRAARSKRMPMANVGGTTEDIDNIAVIEDDGSIVTPFNYFDLKGKAVRLTPVAAAGSNRLSIRQADLNPDYGSKLTLNDDDSREFVFAGTFRFPYFGVLYSSVFVNSDGNVTFIQGDSDLTARDLSHLNSGPPRIAPFLVDLDPTVGQGAVFVNQLSDRVMITWNTVREWNSFRENTFQLSLFPDGSFEYVFGQISASKGITGFSAGSDLQSLDIIDISREQGAVITGSVAERFTLQKELDLTAVGKAFYKTHPDSYDQLVMYTNFSWELGNSAFAFEQNIKNETRGIGLGLLDTSSQFGSSGNLESLLAMNQLAAYPDDPDQIFLGTNSAVNLLAHEAGHRWLAYVHLGPNKTTDLLGRDAQHWSFFFNAQASVMEGNEIRDNGDGSFTTTAATNRYGILDQYLMGILDPFSVGSMFYVSGISGVSQNASSPPAVGVTFRGRRQDFTVDDIIAAEGPRIPDVNLASKLMRQAFILVIPQGTTVPQADIDKLSRIRRRWQQFYFEATNGRGSVETTINTIPVIPSVSSIFPLSGSTLGNTVLSITGLNFQPGLAVKIGSTMATNVVYINSSLITAMTPPSLPGSVSVSVINPDGTPVVQSNAFTYLTFGPPRISSNALRIPIAIDNLTYRSNLGVNNPYPTPANVSIKELDRNGLLLRQSPVFSVPAYGYFQKNSILRELEGVSSITGREGSLVLESDQPIESYISLIDNITDDPSVLDGTRSGTSQLILLSSANTGPFQSNLAVVNLSPVSTNVTITSLNRDTGQPQGVPLENVRLAPYGFITFRNILASLSISESFGPIEIHSDNGALLTATSQVSGLNKGTSGFFPALPRNSGSTTEFIPFVVDTETYRTNLGLNNLGSEVAHIQITLIAENGQSIASSASPILVPPLGLVQINNVLRSLVSASSDPARPLRQGYLKITSNTPIKAFATQIDNLTNDPSIEVSVSQGNPHLLLKSSSSLNFQSTISVVNLSDQSNSVELIAHQGDGSVNGAVTGSRTLTIPANGCFITDNLLQFIGSTAAFGPVEIQSLSGSPIIAVSSIYSAAARTSGFFVAQPIP